MKPTIADYQKITGYSSTTVKEKLTKLFETQRARPSVGEFNRAVISDLSETAAARALPEGHLDPNQMRARKDRATAEKIEMENAVRKGELLPFDEVDRANAEIDNLIRSSFLSLAARKAEELAAIDDPRQLQTTLDAEIRKILEELGSEEGDEEE